MHDLDKAIRAALMTAHRYARGGYADRGFVDDAPDSVLMQERDESTYGPTNLDERRQRVQEMSNAQNVATQQYPGDFLEAPQGYITPAKAVRWVNTDAGPMAVDAEGNSLPLIQQPGVLPLYRDPTIDAVRMATPRMLDITGDMMGAPLGMTARRVIQAGMTGERPAANVLNIFAGENAKTADLAALDTAKKMAETGAKREDIIDKTGWFQGADKKWRFEIPDNTSYADVESLAGEGIKLGSKLPFNNVFSHDPLYKAYPETAKTDVRLMRSTDPFAVSSGEKYPLFVSLPEGSSDKLARAKLLHEAQHLVQRQEGFAEGANPKMFQHDEASGLTPYEQYRRSIGEVEARNVERRRYMTPEERQRSYPWATEDVPVEQQIVHSSGAPKTEPQMSVGPAERAENLAKFKSENVEDVPPIVYHGTGNDIHQFDTTKGAWFTDTPSLASEYANKPGGNVVPAHIALKNPIEFVHAEQRKPIGEVISTALSGAHDLSAEQINAAKPIVNILRERYGKNARPLFEYWNNDPDITKLFKTLGYDGISVFEKADRKAKTWSIFSPEQAKSAIGNAGTFNPKSPKLNEARGGTIPFGPEAAQRAVQIAKQQAGRR